MAEERKFMRMKGLEKLNGGHEQEEGGYVRKCSSNGE
jgi:hypothetical protein